MEHDPYTDHKNNQPEIDTHDEDHSRMLAEVVNLHPESRAVLVVIEPKGEEESTDEYILTSYGCDDRWDSIMGVLAVGQAYASSELFGGMPREQDSTKPQPETSGHEAEV